MSKMKTLSKALSSPGRPDKFPTPLMLRFLRSNVGSRSRGRSRSSPLFILRSKKNAAAINEATQQEPSSPKVTCIGQVRARRSSKAKAKASRSRSRRKTSKQSTCGHPCSCSCSCPFSCSCSSSSCYCCCCFSCCVPKTRFCCHFSPNFRKPRLFPRNFFRKWVYFFRFGYCKKIDVRDDSVQVMPNQRGHNDHHVSSGIIKAVDIENEQSTFQKNNKEDFHESSSTFSPPKNALLLTRCRSAPYRSSSLAGKFWESPLRESETETETLRDESKEPPDDGAVALKDDFREPVDYGGNGQPNSPINDGNDAESVAVISRNSNSKEEEGTKEEQGAMSVESRNSSSQEEEEDEGAEGGGGGNSKEQKAVVVESRNSSSQEEEEDRSSEEQGALVVESRNSRNQEEEEGSGSCEELDSSTNDEDEKTKEDSNRQEPRVGGSSVQVHPLILMRCKSEPAKTGERLNPPEVNFSKQRRSDTSKSCLQEIKLNL